MAFLNIAIGCLLFLCGHAFASLESPASKTVWDRIMEEQSALNLRKGYTLMSSEQYPQAADEFLKALEKNPDDPGARVLYGASLYWMGEPQKALDEFDTVLKHDPQNAMAFQLKGIVLAWKGDGGGALDNFIKADAIAKDKADIKMNIGSVYHSMGFYDKALDYSRQAVSLEPDNPLYRFQLGLLYSRLGRYEQAVVELKKALSIYSDYEDAMLELAALDDRLGQYDLAIKLYRKALALKPGDSVARFRLVWALLKTGVPRGGEIRKIVEEAFLLTPKNDKGGISIKLAYAGGAQGSGAGQAASAPNSPAQTAQTSEGGSPLENAVAKVSPDEDIKIKVEILELPKTSLVKAGSENLSALKDQLAGAYKKPRLSYTKKEYFLPAGNSSDRMEKASAISAEIKKIMQGISPANDSRLSLNIETHKSAGGRAAGGPKAGEVVYNPRDVGNDMGLWVIGDNWLENVSDALDEMEASEAKTVPFFGAVRGLGRLLLGQPDDALAEFNAAGAESGVLAYLGRSVALVEKGDEAGALKACREALKKEPKDKTALANSKWLSGGQ